MSANLTAALRTTVVTLVLTGLAYPLFTTAVALALFPDRARGTIATDDAGQIVGSELIGQAFAKPEYLQPRPSAVSYDAAGSGGSNYGPTSKALRERVEKERERLQRENPRQPPPLELLTASASGLDPHLSPEAAFWQLPRIARARGVAPERVRTLIEAHVEGRDLGILGEPRVNVLLVNLALDRHFGRPR